MSMASTFMEDPIFNPTYDLTSWTFYSFFLNILKEKVGRVSIRVMGNFKILIPSKNLDISVIEGFDNKGASAILKIKFPTFFNKEHIKLEAEFYEKNFEQIFESRLADLRSRLRKPDIISQTEFRKGIWCDLKPIEVTYFLKALGRFSLKEFFKILVELKPVKNNIAYIAGINISKYGDDRRQRLLKSMLEFERSIASKRAMRKLREVKGRMLKETDATSLIEAVQKIQEEKLKEYEDIIEFLYISRGVNDNLISKAKPKKQIKFKLWERDLEDLFTGHYSGTCIALDERPVMPLYLKDPHTEFFRIIVNERRIGHVKMFHCKDEDGENVLHIDFIGLSGGRFKPLHEEIKKYAVTACIKYAQSKGFKRVYIAKDIIPNLNGKLMRNKLVKEGLDVYSQYLNSEKFLVWERE